MTTHILVPKVEHEQIPDVHAGQPSPARAIASPLRPLQEQGEGRVRPQVIRVPWGAQLDVAVSAELHGDDNLP